MKQKSLLKIISMALAAVLLLTAYWFGKRDNREQPDTRTGDFHLQPDRKNAEERKNTDRGAGIQDVIDPAVHLIYTKHARCRMACRDISEEEIAETLKEGHINWRKSKADEGQCPTYAIEDKSEDGQDLRIVFAKCSDNVVKVVTCIDLGAAHDCYCD